MLLCFQDAQSDERFHVELHFSPGAYNLGAEKHLPSSRGYRPQQSVDKARNHLIPDIYLKFH